MIYNLGREYIVQNPVKYGMIDHRPTDRRENYVKRCVGLPGQTLQIKNRIVYLDGKPNKEPDNVQYFYYVKLKRDLPDDVLKDLGISMEDLGYLNQGGAMPLTKRAVNYLSHRKDLIIRLDAGPRSRRIIHDRNHGNLVILEPHVDTNSAKRSYRLLHELVIGFRVKIDGMGISKGLYHAGNRPVHEFRAVYICDVMGLDQPIDSRKA